MQNFFTALETVGFNDTNNVQELHTGIPKDTVTSSLTSLLPQDYLDVIEKYEDAEKRRMLLAVANNISLFIKTKFNDSQLSNSWYLRGTLPNSYHQGLGTNKLSVLASKLIRLDESIRKDKERVRELDAKIANKEKVNSRTLNSLDNTDQRLRANLKLKNNLQEEFYFAFIDLESSVGGVY
ncbi:hypothetical protein [Shewanella mangrovisoli]|uniref:hypothetical protein n=1 Tax=Shewanella mangrovisoli TaxID=2864211 RepID=UPI0035B99050